MYSSSDLIEIISASESLSEDIRNSEIAKEYFEKKAQLASCKDAQELIKNFNKNKIRFDEAERFGKYYPDYDLIVKETLKSKKEMDMHDAVMNFKKCETQFLEMLTEISQIISSAVSDNIEVPSATPLSKKKNCNCGGSCGCS